MISMCATLRLMAIPTTQEVCFQDKLRGLSEVVKAYLIETRLSLHAVCILYLNERACLYLQWWHETSTTVLIYDILLLHYNYIW